MRTGYEAALSRNAEIVVTLDADGQHRPEEIERLEKLSSKMKPTSQVAQGFLESKKKEVKLDNLGYTSSTA